MTLGNKLAKLRKVNGYTQEHLAELLGVSRQSVSKWESDLAYPETEKLVRLGELYGCSMDDLLYDARPFQPKTGGGTVSHQAFHFTEKKSRATLCGLPLWHMGDNAKGIVAIGVHARGILAIGINARGVLSLGLFSSGIFSFGSLSMGVLSFGAVSLGVVAFGGFAIGMLAAGALSLGVFTLGALAAGDFSIGALALGRYAAMGDSARGMVAIGQSDAAGKLWQTLHPLTSADFSEISAILDANVPIWLNWAKKLFLLFCK